ncbi:anhydro-N-acetylmuramic acid kinase [Nitrosomonas aestuarii]|uniref:Anhydro-N-acetylmuramic acid kinase n=1 Tax=Nitrosomonas aestuarii TaxID=52441 RepID=A0A1I3Z182_9PROT|nr:anhydro-N-acetylmuramic acid kinase [Nitrosomonas aestuarii]SFK37843.1 anhydro-N-acetylmuramic acid kinase [Nitrosomonas aestuarii]
MESGRYIGIMSGTSLDGVDAVLVDFDHNQRASCIETFFSPFDNTLRSRLLALHHSGGDELNKAALISNQLSHQYARAVAILLERSALAPRNVIAIGCHGQTIRHCPEIDKSYTIQLVNAALLAELTEITVIADFRNRDIAAGGQGAPLVPAFHKAMFMDSNSRRTIINIGGIANLTYLDPKIPVSGFDCGPGNLLMDAWCLQHTGQSYDKNGQWAATGQVIPALLDSFISADYFACTPPKSTGRDLFNITWLRSHLQGHESPEDVQATLMQLTITSITQSIEQFYPATETVYVCGGGAHNFQMMRHLKNALSDKKLAVTDELGVQADWVEACAFAWLARQAILKQPGNIPSVTGAKGERILGAIYSA